MTSHPRQRVPSPYPPTPALDLLAPPGEGRFRHLDRGPSPRSALEAHWEPPGDVPNPTPPAEVPPDMPEEVPEGEPPLEEPPGPDEAPPAVPEEEPASRQPGSAPLRIQ
jgi:hypothetical protein